MHEGPAPSGLWMTRRLLLQRAGVGASLLTLARLPLAPRLACATAAGPETGAVLSAYNRELLTQVAERLVYSPAPDAPPLRATGAIATVERLLAQVDPAVRADLPLALRLFDWGPVLFDFRLSRFTALDDAGKDAVLRGWMESRLTFRRLVFEALRNLAFVGYYSQDVTWQAIGYKGPLLAGGSLG